MSALAYSIATAADATSLSQATISRAIKARVLKAKKTSLTKDGEPTGNWVILRADLEAWLESLPDS